MRIQYLVISPTDREGRRTHRQTD